METNHDAGSGNQHGRISRRTMLRGAAAVASATTTGGTEGLASLVVPGAVQGVNTAGVFADLLSAARYACSGTISREVSAEFSWFLEAPRISEHLKLGVRDLVSERISGHFEMLKVVREALARVELSPDGPRVLEELRRDSAALREAWQQRRCALVDGAIALIQQSWIAGSLDGQSVRKGFNELTDGFVGGEFHGLIVAVSPEERDWMMKQLSPESVREHIRESNRILERGTTIADILDWALMTEELRTRSGMEPQSQLGEMKEFDTLKRALEEKYGVQWWRLIDADALLRGLSNPLGRHTPFDLGSENGYCAEIPRLAHSGFLSLRTDVLDLFKEFAAPRGQWLSDAHQEAYRRLGDSLDVTIQGLAEKVMNKYFPEYMAVDSPHRQAVENELTKRRERAVEKQRAAEVERTNFAWPGLEGPGNDYY